MKYLHYTTYCRGGSGLSNGIMSIEIGVVLAYLMERVLIIDGNASPSANLVDYGDGQVPSNRSRITDLFDLPIPWVDAEDSEIDPDHEIDPDDAPELIDTRLMEAVFYYPPEVDTTSADFKAFANGRTRFVTESNRARNEPVLRIGGGPEIGGNKLLMHNLSFYSYFFYLDAPTRRRVDALLRRMKPRAGFTELAEKIAADLGEFNAVHIRRGDFKQTFGVTTLERKPSEVLETLDHHFDRKRPLLILTDEMADPFFGEILQHYDDAVFADELILSRYREEFLALPFRDNIALAFLSQLVAAKSADFIGSMTSTFTSMIQRWRGNAGLPEPFKFLWNELPEEGEELKRGSHSRNQCVPMQHGIMVEESSGPYSWNRFNSRVNPAWMREWPESFLSASAGEAEAEEKEERGRVMSQDQTQAQVRSAAEGDQEVEVKLCLLGGHQHTLTLPANSEILHDLISALALSTQPHPRALPRFFQIPTDAGRSALSFSSNQLISISTTPPVLLED